MADQEAIELLYSQLHALPDPEFGVINMLPFAQDSEQTNAIKRRVAKAICRVFESGGYLLTKDKPQGDPPRSVSIQCRSCGNVILSATIDARSGVSAVPAATLITAIANMNVECPHKPLTLEDQRRKIEQALQEGE